MAAKKVVNIEGVGEVTIVKRRGNRNIRLSYDRSGNIRVSLPYFAPYESGITFVKSKSDWLAKHRPEKPNKLSQGDRVGKAHRVHFIISDTATRPSVRLAQTKIQATLPTGLESDHDEAQAAIIRGAHRALKREADQLLPQRLSQLAQQYGFTYKSITTKRLSSRWGSCSQHKEIILNIYLMQLPWHLIDYVIVHELVHTEHLNHSADFWKRFEQIMPDAKKLRKELKTYPTTVQSLLT